MLMCRFEPDHFETLVERFVDNPRLGVAGAPFRKETFNTTTDLRALTMYGVVANYFVGSASIQSAAMSPLKGGGVDLVAVVTARMNGWETRTYPERRLHSPQSHEHSHEQGAEAQVQMGPE